MAVRGKVAVAALAALASLAGGAPAQQPAPPDSAAAAASAGRHARAHPATDSTSSPKRLRRQFGFDGYAHDILGPGAWLGTGLSTGMQQAQNSPSQWGGGASGFSKRAASNFGSLVAGETVRHGLAAAMGRSTDYQRCGCTSFGGRIRNGFAETFTDRDREGRRAFSIPRVAGIAAGAAAPLLWWPGESVRGAGTAAIVSLGLTLGGDVLDEFVRIWR